MRFLLVISVGLATLAGCPISRSDELSGAPGDDNAGSGGQPSSAYCARDQDCELAAATCCECPTFAANVNDPSNRACTGVACPMEPVCPANVRAACDLANNQCTVACVEMACPLGSPTSCAEGYKIDPATGCLSCECAGPAQLGGCTADTDCVQTREDCCGCARGGTDTAVLASQLASHDQSLGCPQAPQCPGLDTCDPAAEPRCIQGTCTLTDAVLPPNACGNGQGCPNGETCVVNHDPVANQLGVGVCVP